ncbi:MAG: TRAP transporter large permease, partial [Pseudomonadota bacterium]
SSDLCNAGTLGILIPPSIVMVVYAAATDVSVGRMFLAGVFPGLLAGLMLMIGIYVVARYKNLPAQPWAGFAEVVASAREAMWGLFLIIIILGGIYGGVFTPTEAAAVSAVYAFVIANFVYRDMGPLHVAGQDGAPDQALSLREKPQALLTAWVHPDTKKALLEAGKLSVLLLFIIANALVLKHVLTEQRIPQMMTEALTGFGFSPWMFLVVVNVILLVAGQFLEPAGLLIVIAPLLFPIAIELGIDPIHLGIIMVVNMEIAMITPPVGLNLFVTAAVAKMSVAQVVMAALPWVAIMFVFLLIVTYVPAVSTWLPTTLMGPEIITK